MIAIDFPVFVAVWNHQQGQTTPEHHNRIALWLQHRWDAGDRQLLLMAFRNSGKSTLVGLFAAWLLACRPDQRILVLAADLALARKMVRNTKRLIERHKLTEGLKPPRADQWAADQFTVLRPAELRDPSMLARGIQANLTGSRADVVICDDVEVPNTCDTALKRADLRARLAEVDCVLTPGGLQLYVGTPHTWYTIYAETARAETGESAPFLDGFRRLVIPLVGPDGASAWPERFTPQRIAQIRRHTGPNKFESQMQLRPVNITDSRLDPDRLRPYDGELEYREGGGAVQLLLAGRRLVSASCWWDPAFAGARPDGGEGNGGDRGDGSVIAAVFADAEGRCYLHRIAWLNGGAAPPAVPDGEDEATRQCRAVAALVRELHLPAVSIEINGLGRFLPGLLRRELRLAGVSAAVLEIASRKPKDQRILEAFDARLAAGCLYAHRTVWATPFLTEMREWQPGGLARGHDDGLDAVAGCLLAEPVRLGRGISPARGRDWRPGGGSVRAETEFVP